MAELATIARPYAEALFKAAKSDLAGTAVWLDAVAAVAANPLKVREIFRSLPDAIRSI